MLWHAADLRFWLVHTVDGGRINIAACSVGGAQFCVDHAAEYVASRQQFGQPVGRFQNTQFRLADMATGISASRLMVRWVRLCDLRRHYVSFCTYAV